MTALPKTRTTHFKTKVRLENGVTAMFRVDMHEDRFNVVFITLRKTLEEDLPALGEELKKR